MQSLLTEHEVSVRREDAGSTRNKEVSHVPEKHERQILGPYDETTYTSKYANEDWCSASVKTIRWPDTESENIMFVGETALDDCGKVEKLQIAHVKVNYIRFEED